MQTFLRSIFAPSLLALAAGCTVASKPRADAAQPHQEEPPPVTPSGGGAVVVPDAGATGPGDAAPAPPPSCTETLEEYCSTHECPTTWADGQTAASAWCSKPPFGADAQTVDVSKSACGGFFQVGVGDTVGLVFVYDATLSSLVAVYEYGDVWATSCFAGTPVPSGTLGCDVKYICSDGLMLGQ